MTKFRRKFKKAQNVKKARKHANALGFEIVKVVLSGSWEDDTGLDYFPSSGEVEVQKFGRKYVYVWLEEADEYVPVKPSSHGMREAKITVTFSDQ